MHAAVQAWWRPIKIVVSNQQLQFTWRNSEQVQGDLVEFVTALKNEPAAPSA